MATPERQGTTMITVNDPVKDRTGSTLVLEEQASTSLQRLQSSLRALIDATPGVTRRATDLQRTLRVHSKVAWQVHRIAHTDDLFGDAGHVPGSTAMKRFLEAARERGVPTDLTDLVANAHEDFESLISHHAGTRSEFTSMLSGFAEEGSDHVDLASKRAAFKAQSHLLGVQAELHIATFIFRANQDDASLIDAVTIRGLVGLRWNRKGVNWSISAIHANNDDGSPRLYPGPEPLAPAGEERAGGLLPQFCSKPLPRLRYNPAGEGVTHVELEPGRLGMEGAVSCFLGHTFPRVLPRFCDDKNRYHRSHTRVRTPCQWLLHDTIVDRHLFQDRNPQVGVYSDHRDDIDRRVSTGREGDRLALRESIVYLGDGINSAEFDRDPQYQELVAYAFDRVGWDSEQFSIYRSLIEYPVMPSSVVVQFELPDP